MEVVEEIRESGGQNGSDSGDGNGGDGGGGGYGDGSGARRGGAGGDGGSGTFGELREVLLSDIEFSDTISVQIGNGGTGGTGGIGGGGEYGTIYEPDGEGSPLNNEGILEYRNAGDGENGQDGDNGENGFVIFRPL